MGRQDAGAPGSAVRVQFESSMNRPILSHIRVALAGALLFIAVFPVARIAGAETSEAIEGRKPSTEEELRFWLENMVWYHQFSEDEISAATGLAPREISDALTRFDIHPSTRPSRPVTAPLFVLPYPGGRHPRIGFLDGAIDPQRETKFSVFTPWDENSYVVVDLPEAIWSNLGLTYLAHRHVPTIWTEQKMTLPKLEWRRNTDGTLSSERTLPNGIRFGAVVRPQTDAVRMELWLMNGTADRLTDLRVQMCAMLKGVRGFDQQTNDNKWLQKPYAACRSEDGQRWIITAWEPAHRTWANAPVPCLHADPKIPDCAPGETQRLHGWLSFYEGADIEREIRRIDATGWRRGADSH